MGGSLSGWWTACHRRRGRRLAVLARLFGQAAMVGCKRGQDVRLPPLI